MNGWALDSQVPLAPFPLGVGGYKSTTFHRLWPAAYTYKLLIEKLDGITACRRLPMPENVYVYECTIGTGRRVIVAFYDDHIAQNHDQPTGTKRIILPVGSPRVRLTHLVTDLEQTTPRTEVRDAPGNRLPLLLTEYPVFVEQRDADAP